MIKSKTFYLTLVKSFTHYLFQIFATLLETLITLLSPSLSKWPHRLLHGKNKDVHHELIRNLSIATWNFIYFLLLEDNASFLSIIVKFCSILPFSARNLSHLLCVIWFFSVLSLSFPIIYDNSKGTPIWKYFDTKAFFPPQTYVPVVIISSLFFPSNHTS